MKLSQEQACKILEIQGSFDLKDLKKHYRLASSKYHPDRNPGGQEMMKMVNVAYDLLKKNPYYKKTEYSNKKNDDNIASKFWEWAEVRSKYTDKVSNKFDLLFNGLNASSIALYLVDIEFYNHVDIKVSSIHVRSENVACFLGYSYAFTRYANQIYMHPGDRFIYDGVNIKVIGKGFVA